MQTELSMPTVTMQPIPQGRQEFYYFLALIGTPVRSRMRMRWCGILFKSFICITSNAFLNSLAYLHARGVDVHHVISKTFHEKIFSIT